MNRITTLIVDDEPDGRETLARFLNRYCQQIEILGSVASVGEAAAHIRALDPQLVFLDINMPGESGFDLFRHIPEPDFQTIFVTAYDEFALKAIKHHALDYILKPINITELTQAVARAEALLKRSPTQPDIRELLQSLRTKSTHSRICLPVGDGFVYVPVQDIVRCEADGGYTVFHFAQRPKMIICATLGQFEEQLKDQGFIRVHHHHLINIAHVDRYQRGRGGIVFMSDKTEVVVSQRKREEFLRIAGL